jgi:hypothetical protein
MERGTMRQSGRATVVLCTLVLGFVAGAAQAQTAAVGVANAQITVNGVPTRVFGFRVGSAAMRSDSTAELVAQLPYWKGQGIEALVLFLQGTSGGYTRVFDDAGTFGMTQEPVIVRTGFGVVEQSAVVGTASGEDVAARTEEIIRAAQASRMIVFLGVIYPSAVTADDTKADVLNMMTSTAQRFGAFTNVVFVPWNQPNTTRVRETVADLRDYALALKAVAPERLVAAGTNVAAQNAAIAAVAEIDIVSQNAGRTTVEAIASFDSLRSFGKPIVNIETYGSNAGGFVDDPSKTLVAPAASFVDFVGWRRVFGAWKEDDYLDGTGRVLVGRTNTKALIAYVGTDVTNQTGLIIHVGGWFQGASRVESPAQLGPWGSVGQWNNVFQRGWGSADGTVDDDGRINAPGIKWILRAVQDHKQN